MFCRASLLQAAPAPHASCSGVPALTCSPCADMLPLLGPNLQVTHSANVDIHETINTDAKVRRISTAASVVPAATVPGRQAARTAVNAPPPLHCCCLIPPGERHPRKRRGVRCQGGRRVQVPAGVHPGYCFLEVDFRYPLLLPCAMCALLRCTRRCSGQGAQVP